MQRYNYKSVEGRPARRRNFIGFEVIVQTVGSVDI